MKLVRSFSKKKKKDENSRSLNELIEKNSLRRQYIRMTIHLTLVWPVRRHLLKIQEVANVEDLHLDWKVSIQRVFRDLQLLERDQNHIEHLDHHR